MRTGDEEPSPGRLREALRDVVSRCVYGVDVNPMAVELCKVSLWMEALVPGRPLTFLDAHLRVGNSLLGATLGLIEDGVPDAAYKALLGDDKDVVRSLKQQNGAECAGQLTTEDLGDGGIQELAREALELESATDYSLESVRKREQRFQQLASSAAAVALQSAAHGWTAAFLVEKAPSRARITTGTVRRLATGVEQHDEAAAVRGTATGFRPVPLADRVPGSLHRARAASTPLSATRHGGE